MNQIIIISKSFNEKDQHWISQNPIYFTYISYTYEISTKITYSRPEPILRFLATFPLSGVFAAPT